MRTALDPRQADQQVRDVVVLPQRPGQDGARAGLRPGRRRRRCRAPLALTWWPMTTRLLKKIEGGVLDFDVAIATPDAMGKVGRLGRVLGPRGLMPNPKAGTVVPAQDLERAIKEAKAGRVEFRLDKTGNIHVSVGKASFTPEKLHENFAALMDAIRKARPSGAKGAYIKHITVATTMGPAIKVDPSEAAALEVQRVALPDKT
ncbi:MAG: 50S ribosomal protein L1 [Anaerolineae bacterium]